MPSAAALLASLRSRPSLVTAEIEHVTDDDSEMLFVECDADESPNAFGGGSGIGVRVAEPFGVTALGVVVSLTDAQCREAVAQVERKIAEVARG